MTGDAVAASIAHEVKQPLTAMVTSADAGFRFLDRSTPNLDRAKEAFKRIVADGHRAGAVVESIRANFRNDERTRTSLDVNELIRNALALEHGDLEKHRILVQAEPNKQLPEVRGNRVQLQQVLLNLITNAIDAMAAKDEPRVLCVKSEAYEGDSVMVSVADTGTRNQPARHRSDIQSALHDQIRRHGHGSRRFAERSSRPTMAGCGFPRTLPVAPCFNLPCTPIIRHPPVTDRQAQSKQCLSIAHAGSGSSVFRASRPFLPARQAIRRPSSS